MQRIYMYAIALALLVSNSQAEKPEAFQPNLQTVLGTISSEFGPCLSVDDRLHPTLRGMSVLNPKYLIADLNGDGIPDLIVSVKVSRPKCDFAAHPPFRLLKPGPSGSDPDSDDLYTYGLDALLRYENDHIIAIVLGSRKLGWSHIGRGRKFVLLDTGLTRGYITMSISRRPLKPVQGFVADAPDPALPKLRGDALLLLQGDEGQAIFWDGHTFEWYPIRPTSMQ